MPEITEYKGNKMICLNPGSKFVFSFGISKAKMILENIEAIKTFINTNGESCDSSKPVNDNTSEKPF
jgi:hypothetical protein